MARHVCTHVAQCALWRKLEGIRYFTCWHASDHRDCSGWIAIRHHGADDNCPYPESTCTEAK